MVYDSNWSSNNAASVMMKSIFLLKIIFITLISWKILKWIWGRRKLYALSLKIPGPFALPLAGCIAEIIAIISDSDPFISIRKTLRRYEPELMRYWMGTELVIIVHKPEDVESVMKCKTISAKPPNLFNLWTDSLGDGLLTSPGVDSLWKNHRRIISPSFSFNVLSSYQPIMQKHSEMLLKDMEKLLGQGIQDYSLILGRYVGDVVSDSLFNYKSKFRDGENDDTLHSADWICAAIYKRWLHFWNILDVVYWFCSVRPNQMKATRLLREFSKRIRDEQLLRYKNKDNSKDIINPSTIDVLLKAELDGYISEDEVLDEVMNVWGAGFDTVNMDLVLTVLMLAIHKEYQEKAFEEIRSFYKDNPTAPVEKKDLQQFPYLEMCLKEVLRLFPAGLINFRYVTKEFVMQNRNLTIPAGTTIGMALIISQRDPDVWPDPYAYKPERFTAEEMAKRHPFAYYPFSGGARNCIGQKYGMILLKTAMVYILRKYEVHSDWKLSDIPLEYDVNVRSAWGYKASFSLRKW